MAFAGSIAPCVPVPQHSIPAASPVPADARTPNELLHGWAFRPRLDPYEIHTSPVAHSLTFPFDQFHVGSWGARH